ncbi:hypothetical protein ASF08_23050 [Methylobacterium sp. Leaf85]|nr:hypothetical protein ASF08_23050 [Methylobacterium sp. Leaf85]
MQVAAAGAIGVLGMGAGLPGDVACRSFRIMEMRFGCIPSQVQAMLDLVPVGEMSDGVPDSGAGVASGILDLVRDVAHGIPCPAVEVLGGSLGLVKTSLRRMAVRTCEVADGALYLAAEFLGGARDAMRIDYVVVPSWVGEGWCSWPGAPQVTRYRTMISLAARGP